MIERLNFITEKIKQNDKVSFDADGVLVDSATSVVNEFNNLFGTSYKRQEVSDWFSIRNWAMKEGLSKNDAEELNYKLWTDPDLLQKALPMPGSIDVYRNLSKISGEIPIITVRNFKLRDVTIEWFNKYIPEMPNCLINMRESDDIKDNVFKIQAIKDKRIKWHFDDSLNVILLTIKNTTSNLFYIASAKTPEEINESKRVTVIPNFEWSPEIYS